MTSNPTESACSICNGTEGTVLYSGPVRVGRFGMESLEGIVVRCAQCRAARLTNAPSVDYTESDYRLMVDGSIDVAAQHAMHDVEQLDKLQVAGVSHLRGRVVADVGASVGSFLDVAHGVAQTTIAIEPARQFHDALRAAGHQVYPFADDAQADWAGRVDMVVSFSVIEHVDDPVRFLKSMRALLKPGGRVLLSTPNLDDWLLELLPDSYAAFFYRAVHRWYFDAPSLRHLARDAGFAGVEVKYVHRFDLSNLLVWLRDRRPSGLAALPVSPFVDAAFKEWLESNGRSDYMYAWLST